MTALFVTKLLEDFCVRTMFDDEVGYEIKIFIFNVDLIADKSSVKSDRILFRYTFNFSDLAEIRIQRTTGCR